MRFQSYSIVNRSGTVLYHPDPNISVLQRELLDVSRLPGYSLMVDVGDMAYKVVDIDIKTGDPICLDTDGSLFLDKGHY